MEITVAVIITAITLIAGEITKLTNLDNKWIPLQNIIIAIVASIICILFNVEDMSVLETVVTCIFATMSARWYCRFKENKGGKVIMENEELIENTELVAYTDESIDDNLEMEGVEE